MSAAWTEREVIHLLNRAAFGCNEQEIEACLSYGREETVRRLVSGKPLVVSPQPVADIKHLQADGKALSEDQLTDQQVYWLYRMICTDTPLVEKMTLFWHGHFTSAQSKVGSVPLMVRQNKLFRNYALDSFRDLLLAVGNDPAMMIWLDTNSNKKGSPNENYAREVMELFTLGLNHYTESDVREAARAFTGWNYDRKTDRVTFNPKQFDNGAKQVLGHQGNLNAETLTDVLLEQKALYTFLANKLLQTFVQEQPSQTWMNRVSSRLAQASTIGEVLYDLFMSDEFYSDEIMQSLIKSPVEFIVTLARALALPLSKNMAYACKSMGQELYNPPNVSGWRGHASWLVTSYHLARLQFAEYAANHVSSKWLAPPAVTTSVTSFGQLRIKQWARRLGLASLQDATLDALNRFSEQASDRNALKESGMRHLLQLLLMSPEIQLK